MLLHWIIILFVRMFFKCSNSIVCHMVPCRCYNNTWNCSALLLNWLENDNNCFLYPLVFPFLAYFKNVLPTFEHKKQPNKLNLEVIFTSLVLYQLFLIYTDCNEWFKVWKLPGYVERKKLNSHLIMYVLSRPFINTVSQHQWRWWNISHCGVLDG